MENSFESFDQDILITENRLNKVEQEINYLEDINSLILELKRIREELNNM